MKVMKRRLILLFLFLFVATTTFAAEDRIKLASVDKESADRARHKYRPPMVIEKNDYYEIRGSSEKDLRNQMLRNGCTWEDGQKYDSVTSWYWTWDYGRDHTSQTCSAEDFSVTLEIILRLPKWVRTDDAPQTLVDKWEEYMKNLIVHENGHRDRIVAAAAALSRAVAALPPALSCADRERHVRALSSEMRVELNTAQQKYDAATDHGATQGALFP